MGTVERAIRNTFRDDLAPPVTLHTYGENKPFELHSVDSEGIVLWLGTGGTRPRIAWDSLEGIPAYLRATGPGDGWVVCGGLNSKTALPRTLDWYLKEDERIPTNVARWLAVVLHLARVIDVDTRRPLRVKVWPGLGA